MIFSKLKISAYTGWDYEYVEGTWSELMQKLKSGDIDLLSDVSYSEERTKDMLFSSIPMGTEVYYLFVSPDEKEITSENISSLNGKRIGITQGSIQKDFFIDWTEKRGIKTNIIEMTCPEEESIKMLGTKLDAIVTMDVYGSPQAAVPVFKIGSSDFYFAVNKERPDILYELDAALNRIQDENKYSVRNKGTFTDYIQNIQDKIDSGEQVEFAIGIFDCNNLKVINDCYGHDKGDIYLKKACQLICKIFDHSPVFRIGGDEFAVILQNDDYKNRETLAEQFTAECLRYQNNPSQNESCEESAVINEWEQINTAVGIAVYDPENENSVTDTMRRADKIMYENKRNLKKMLSS